MTTATGTELIGVPGLALAGTGDGFLGETGPATVDMFSPTAVRGEGWTKWLKAS